MSSESEVSVGVPRTIRSAGLPGGFESVVTVCIQRAAVQAQLAFKFKLTSYFDLFVFVLVDAFAHGPEGSAALHLAREGGVGPCPLVKR